MKALFNAILRIIHSDIVLVDQNTYLFGQVMINLCQCKQWHHLLPFLMKLSVILELITDTKDWLYCWVQWGFKLWTPKYRKHLYTDLFGVHIVKILNLYILVDMGAVV